MRSLALLMLWGLFCAPAAAELEDPSMWAELAAAYNQRADFTKAEAAAERALAINPHHRAALIEGALAKANLAIRLNPGGAEGFALRAAANGERGVIKPVLKDLRAAALRDPRYGRAAKAFAASQGAAATATASKAHPPWAAPLAGIVLVLAIGAIIIARRRRAAS